MHDLETHYGFPAALLTEKMGLSPDLPPAPILHPSPRPHAPAALPFGTAPFLQLLHADPAARTLTFHIPALCSTDLRGYTTSYTLNWIHPAQPGPVGEFDYNPGEQIPNFSVERDTSHVGSDLIDDLETVEDLVCWLEEMREAVTGTSFNRR